MAQTHSRQKSKQGSASRKTKAVRKPGEAKSGLRSTWTEGMEHLYKPIKKPVTLRLDADVIAWFQHGGRGYQTRINKALRKLMLHERKVTM